MILFEKLRTFGRFNMHIIIETLRSSTNFILSIMDYTQFSDIDR